MDLTPEERRKIYEEEKARLEAEQQEKEKIKERPSGSDTGLDSNVAGFLCYLGTWVTGIIFLILEKKDSYVRFHALQSTIIFGTLTLISIILSKIPFIGGILGAVVGIAMFILWIVLMIKAYQGEHYKIPVAGDIAGNSFPPGEPYMHTKDEVTGETEAEPADETKVESKEESAAIQKTSVEPEKEEDTRKKKRIRYKNTRAGRIAASSAAIIWSMIVLIFFSFFSSYIAFYEQHISGGNIYWTRTPILTDAYYEWLPILVATLLLTIAGHIILLRYDRHWLRQTTQIILNILSIIAVVSLLVIFPFNFGAAPGTTNMAITLSILTTIVLIAIAVGLGIATVVIFIKLIAHLAGGNSEPSHT
jgi:uncharacterized membrane protein